MRSVTAEELEVLKSQGNKILVDYWASWCNHCQGLISRLEELEKTYTNITFVKINIEENKNSAVELGINIVPTIMIYNGDNLINRSLGVNQDIFYTKILDSI